MTGSRYAVQERFAPLGPAGQEHLAAARVAVVGVGALGGTSAMLLARAGVGRLRLIDADCPSLENLHRQLLYTEADVAEGASKAADAARALAAANSLVAVEAVEVMLDPANAAVLLAGADVVLDGLDNPAGRAALNRACLELGIPWVHAGVAGSSGQLLVIRPGLTPCLECWAPAGRVNAPRRSVATEGVIGPLPAVMASLQANEAIKLLTGAHDALLTGMLVAELWPPRFRVLAMDPARRRACPTCAGGAGGEG